MQWWTSPPTCLHTYHSLKLIHSLLWDITNSHVFLSKAALTSLHRFCCPWPPCLRLHPHLLRPHLCLWLTNDCPDISGPCPSVSGTLRHLQADCLPPLCRQREKGWTSSKLHTHMHAHTCMRTFTHACAHTHTHTHTHACAHILTHTHTQKKNIYSIYPNTNLPLHPIPHNTCTSKHTLSLSLHTHTHTHTHTHMHARMCTHMHTHTHACMHARTHTHTHTHILTCTHACAHTCTHTHMHACTHAHTHTHTCMHARMHTHTHTPARTHTHTQLHWKCTLTVLLHQSLQEVDKFARRDVQTLDSIQHLFHLATLLRRHLSQQGLQDVNANHSQVGLHIQPQANATLTRHTCAQAAAKRYYYWSLLFFDWLMIIYTVLFSALLSRLTALACGSTWVTSFF